MIKEIIKSPTFAFVSIILITFLATPLTLRAFFGTLTLDIVLQLVAWNAVVITMNILLIGFQPKREGRK